MIFKKLKNAKDCLQIQLWDEDDKKEFLWVFFMYIFNAGWWVTILSMRMYCRYTVQRDLW